MHEIRFPGESAEYRQARDELLRAEIDLRRATEAVAASRRALPRGGTVPEDYAFAEAGGGTVTLSQLFAAGKDTLLLYSFMYGPRMEHACPGCTSVLDALDGSVAHVEQRVNVAVVAMSPPERIAAFARRRGWRHLRLLSSAGTTYNRDYLGEDATGAQMPMLNTFVSDGGDVRHFWGTEILYAPCDPGQDNRQVDFIWPLWNLLDATPGGRGCEQLVALAYD